MVGAGRAIVSYIYQGDRMVQMVSTAEVLTGKTFKTPYYTQREEGLEVRPPEVLMVYDTTGDRFEKVLDERTITIEDVKFPENMTGYIINDKYWISVGLAARLIGNYSQHK